MSVVNRNRARGKSAEKALEKILPNTKRIGVLGAEDLMHPVYSFEVKSCQDFVASKWMAQAIRNMPNGRVPVVLVHVRGNRHTNDFVILRLSDWLKEGDNGL